MSDCNAGPDEPKPTGGSDCHRSKGDKKGPGPPPADDGDPETISSGGGGYKHTAAGGGSPFSGGAVPPVPSAASLPPFSSKAAASTASPQQAPVSLETIQQHFHLPMAEAAASMGLSLSHLKRACRGYNIPRWPSRLVSRAAVPKACVALSC